MERNNKITFLVGAGLVVDAGLPTAIKLTEQFRDYLRTRSIDSDEFRSLLSVYNLLVGGIRFQEGVLDRDPDFPVNIERLATTALYLQRRFESPLAPYASGWHQRLIDLERTSHNVLDKFLRIMFAKLNEWLTPSDATKVSYLAHFNDFCLESWNVDIFSLNYDLCIETALTEISKKPFINGFNEQGWDASQLSDYDSLRLIKLHGSLDWVDDDAFGICSLQFPRCEHAEDIEGNQTPLMIFGTDNKLTGRDPFLTLLFQFASRLSETDLLITIGYSFGDDYLNQVIEQKLSRNTRLRLLVVSPNADALIAKTRFIAGSPRVATLNYPARAVLQDYHLLKKTRELLDLAKDEEPFI